jgi:hypothetical protein
MIYPNPTLIKEYIIKELSSYWQKKEAIYTLPIPSIPWPKEEYIPPKVEFIELPDWAADVGIKGKILVPAQFVKKSESLFLWKEVDWFSAMFWFLNGVAERTFELKYGPIYSYCFRLKNWDKSLWDYAWVNRIALFLRKWAAKNAGGNSDETVCGELPEPKILLTHDLDAIKKTLPIRIKQSIFILFNSFRLFLRANYKEGIKKLGKAISFLFLKDESNFLEKICNLEEIYGIKSLINIYGGSINWKNLLISLLIDPS